ncbi:hypothetical protein [Escherichia phage UPEC03]|nr:hypothetical protein [Escherichia phage UPEC03]
MSCGVPARRKVLKSSRCRKVAAFFVFMQNNACTESGFLVSLTT